MPAEISMSSAPLPAGITVLTALVDGAPVGDLDVRVCEACGVGVIEQVRVAPGARRRGVGTALVRRALEEFPGVVWSATEAEGTDEARRFWARFPGVTVGRPGWCAHMADADAATG